MSHQEWFGLFSVVCALIGYADYLRSVLMRRTRPHVLSWLVWGIVIGIIFVAQWAEGGAAGAWSTGLTAACCLLIAGLSFFYGDRQITVSDWAAFAGALVIIPVWRLTHDPLWAVILGTVIDALAYYPTYRKSYHRPHEEHVFLYAIGILQWGISIFALGEYSAATLIYPIFCVLANTPLVLMILWRRRRLAAR